MTEKLDDRGHDDKPSEVEAWQALQACDLCYRAGPFSSCVHYLEFLKSVARSAGTRTTWAESVAFHTLLQGEGEAYEGPSSYGEALAAHIEECFKVAGNESFCIRRADAPSVIAALRAQSASEASKDTARLDFMENNPRAVSYAVGYRGNSNKWVVQGPNLTDLAVPCDSLRFALDVGLAKNATDATTDRKANG